LLLSSGLQCYVQLDTEDAVWLKRQVARKAVTTLGRGGGRVQSEPPGVVSKKCKKLGKQCNRGAVLTKWTSTSSSQVGHEK
jgi:hypothetical protein